MQLTAAGRGNLRGSLGDGTVATSHSQENGIFASALPCLPSPVFRGTWVCARAAESPQLMRELLGGDNQSLLMIPTAQVRDQKQRELLQVDAATVKHVVLNPTQRLVRGREIPRALRASG
jgi:hypothetical protein